MARIDQYGNMFDDSGNFIGQDYYQSDAWKASKDANDKLQAATEANRQASDSYAASPNAQNAATVKLTSEATALALINYTNATSGPRTEDKKTKVTSDQLQNTGVVKALPGEAPKATTSTPPIQETRTGKAIGRGIGIAGATLLVASLL